MSSAQWQQPTRGGDSVSLLRIVEVATVLLLAVATIGSAWCAYEVSRWNGQETDLARDSGQVRLEASREFGLATQKAAYDAQVTAQYAAAVSSGDERLQAFIRTALIRPEFLPVIERWTAQIQAGETPSNLVEDDEYVASIFARSTALDAGATALSAESERAGENADDYVLATLFMASALFFAGITSSFRARSARLLLLAITVGVLLFAGYRVADLPVT